MGADQAIGTMGTAALTSTVANTRAAAAEKTTREMVSMRNMVFSLFAAAQTIRPAMPRGLQGPCQLQKSAEFSRRSPIKVRSLAKVANLSGESRQILVNVAHQQRLAGFQAVPAIGLCGVKQPISPNENITHFFGWPRCG